VREHRTVIPATAVVQGAIRTDGDIRVDGLYDGPIETTGDLVIGEGARVLGHITAHRISIAGVVKGDVRAYHLEVLETGRVWGDFAVRSVTLAAGSVVSGQLIMHTDASVEDLFEELEPAVPLSPTAPSESAAPAVPGIPLEVEPEPSPAPEVSPRSRPRLLRWLWSYGLAIPLLLLVIAGAYLGYIMRLGRGASHPARRAMAFETRPPERTQFPAGDFTPSALAVPLPTPTALLLPPSPTSTPTSTPTPTPQIAMSPTPVPMGGRLVEVGLSSVSTLNPLLADPGDGLSRSIGGLLFDSLLRVDPRTGAPLPGLAWDWEVSDDSRTFIFHLRPGVTWHDGRPLSSDDVLFTLGVAGDPEGASFYRFDLVHVSRITAPDNATVVITSAEPSCDTLYAVGRVPILPRHLLEGWELDKAAFNRRPVGTGPFVFVSQGADGRITLRANDAYWAGRPRLDDWVYYVAPNVESLEEDLRSGRAHLARLPEDWEMASPPEGYHILSYPGGRWYFLALNNDHPLLHDATIRRALALVLDRGEMLASALKGQGTLMDAPWLSTHWAMEGISLTPLPYAPDQARELLAAAGWHDSDGDGLLDGGGEPLRLSIITHPANSAREQIALLTQQYWRSIGISAQVRMLPWGLFLDDLFRHTFDVAVFDWPLDAAPDQSWLWAAGEDGLGTGFNFISYANDRVDALLEEGRAVPGCDMDSRAVAYQDLARQLIDDQPYIFLFASHQRLAVTDALTGLQSGPYNGLYWNVAQWSLGQMAR